MKCSKLFMTFLIGIEVQAGNAYIKIAPEEEKLVKAVETKNYSSVDEMVNAEVKEDFKEKRDASVLHWAIASRRWEVVKIVLEKLKAKQRFVECASYRINVPVVIATIQHKGGIDAVAWSPDGRNICTGSHDHSAQVWDVVEKKTAGTIQHKGWILAVAWSPDGSKICTGSRDYTAQVWDVLEKKVIGTIQHTASVVAVAWSPDGTKISTGSDDKTVQVWDVLEKKVIETIKDNDLVTAVAWSPDGSKICIGDSGYTAQIWDLVEKKIIGTIFHKSRVVKVAWSPDGSKICTGSSDNTAQVWDAVEKKVVGTIQHKNFITSVAWSPDGNSICTGSWDNTAQIWDVAEKKVIETIQYENIVHENFVNAVAWSPDGSKICTASSDDTVRVWDVKEKNFIRIIQHKAARVVVWSPDGSNICTGSSDRTALLWNLGGTVLDWAVGVACSGGDIRFVEILLAEIDSDLQSFCSDLLIDFVIRKITRCATAVDILEMLISKCEKLDGLCSRTVLLDLKRVQNNIKAANPEGYAKIESLYPAVIKKGNANGQEGFCFIDLAISKIPSSAEAIDVLEMLISKCKKLDGLCSRTVLLDLKRVQNSIKASNPDGYARIESLYPTLIEKGNANGQEGFCFIDLAISKIPSSVEAIDVLKMLISECENLDRLCSKTVLFDLKRAQDSIKESNPDGYAKIETLYVELFEKGSGWIHLD